MKDNMNEVTHFIIHEYGRSELAVLYFPDIHPESAWKKLKSWIKHAPGLEERMMQTGYNKRQHLFTPRQVRMIVDAIGEP